MALTLAPAPEGPLAPESPYVPKNPQPSGPRGDRGDLGEFEASILDFERQWWKHAGAKEQVIFEQFGLTAARYYQTLNSVIDLPEALAYDPMLVKRLRRLRTTRQANRSSSRRAGV